MRKRIVAVAMLAAVLAITLFGVPLALGVSFAFRGDEVGELERLADRTAIAVAGDLASAGDPVELPAAEPGTHLAVYTAEGALLTGDGPPSVTASPDIVTVSDGPDLVVVVPIADNDHLLGLVRSASPAGVVTTRTLVAWASMAGLAAVALTVTWLLARAQARRLARPLEDLSTAAGRLGDGDFTVRARPGGIAEIDDVGASLDRTAARLGALVDRERTFSADASHQLRTPLAGLRLQLEAAGSPAAALETVDRLDRTVADLLALARDVPRDRDPVAAVDLVAGVRERRHGDLARVGRPLRVVVAPDAPATLASAAAVRHALDVLLDNATVHGAGAVTVSAREGVAGGLVLEVVDEGPGPPEGTDLFVRRTEGATGHGIGLALARSLIEAEGGRLLLADTGPTTFRILLPTQDNAER
ncbi:ATP-binding protein [Umezawaea sp. NPDC059074]|uniref:HAMP domain-containing sensor histidine kinase n=1 Tax=Umezawaea sp. NPDC059074 TaxID=3346716 RepID=UPI003679A337